MVMIPMLKQLKGNVVDEEEVANDAREVKVGVGEVAGLPIYSYLYWYLFIDQLSTQLKPTQLNPIE